MDITSANKIFSANRLRDGVVVWLGQGQHWVEKINQAQLFDTSNLDQGQTASDQAQLNNLVVGAQAQPASKQDGHVKPSYYKEQIRAKGPSIRTDLGKQANDWSAGGNTLKQSVHNAFKDHPVSGLYQYDQTEHDFLKERAKVFADQIERRLAGGLKEDEFKTYRLMNGLYLQLHGYMLRVAIPYGTLSANQMRQLAYVARTYDKGYGHFTTRQNLQFNWIRLDQAANILSDLADVNLHAIQTSGNCIRNVTTDEFAGAAANELEDPRVYAEILRQWSTDHPEFTYLPRKFKIAITGSPTDRAAIRFHDIGLGIVKNAEGRSGFKVFAGGGLGRTPITGVCVKEWLEPSELLRFTEAIIRIYNALARRDNPYKARIKMLIRELKPENFIRMVEEEYTNLPDDRPILDEALVNEFKARFDLPVLDQQVQESNEFKLALVNDPEFAHWVKHNTHPHKQSGYISAVISLKPVGGIPGDLSADEMDWVAQLSEQYSHSAIHVSHQQNLVLPHIKKADLYTVWQRLKEAKLATANINQITDMIVCPGMDYCSLANARSIPLAQRIGIRIQPLEKLIGNITMNISGCINACAHHHVANIGILGVDKNGKEFYQITLGGSAEEIAVIGKILGPSVTFDDVPEVIENIVNIYLRERNDAQETFLDVYHRLGPTPFKEALSVTH